jgi:hypothetical protein
MGFESVVVKNHAQSTQQWASRWMILTKNRQYMSQKFIQLEKQKMLMNTGDVRLWTDDFSSPFQLLKK